MDSLNSIATNSISLTFNALPTILITPNVSATDIGNYIMVSNAVSGGTGPFTIRVYA